MMKTSTAALIRRGHALLFVRRPPGGDLGECWELPGGKVDADERAEAALHRELAEELGLDADVGDAVAEAEFRHAGTCFRLIGFEVNADVESARLYEHEEMAFYTVDEALRLRLAPSDASLLSALPDDLR